MNRKLSAWQGFVVLLVLVMGSTYTTNAVAQNGLCVVNTQPIVVNCQACDKNGCSCKGSITVSQATGGYGGGTIFSTTEFTCCLTKVTGLSNPDGNCIVPAAVRAPIVAENRLVLLRDCNGRFKFYSVTG